VNCLAALNGPARNGIQQVLSGSDDGCLRVWDIGSGDCLRVMIPDRANMNRAQPRGSPVLCAIVLQDGGVLSGAEDGALRVWNMSDDVSPEELPILQLKFSQELVLHEPRNTLEPILSVVQLQDGNVLSGCEDTFIRLWNLSTGRCLQKMAQHTAFVQSMIQLQDGRVLTGGYDKTLCIWR